MEEDQRLDEAAAASPLQGQLPGRATFKAHLMDGNPASAFGEQTQAPQEMRRTTNPWRCPRPSGLFSWTVVARPRHCRLEGHCRLEEHCRARCSHPLLSQGQQP